MFTALMTLPLYHVVFISFIKFANGWRGCDITSWRMKQMP